MFVVECLHQHDWFEDFEHQRQSRVKKQRGGEEMLGQSRAEMEQSIGRQELEKSCRVWWIIAPAKVQRLAKNDFNYK